MEPDPLRYLIPLSRGADRVLRALSQVRLDPRTSQSLRRLDLARMRDRGSPREAHSHTERLSSRRSTLSQSLVGLTGLTSTGAPTSIRNVEYSGEGRRLGDEDQARERPERASGQLFIERGPVQVGHAETTDDETVAVSRHQSQRGCPHARRVDDVADDPKRGGHRIGDRLIGLDHKGTVARRRSGRAMSGPKRHSSSGATSNTRQTAVGHTLV